jgi:2-polyprenyl-3-methyl-5-hydroxy-6-metoxy-1,4-benzoquinol methylase
MPDKLRVLVAIASYGAKNDAYLARILDEYRSMHYDLDIVVLSNAPKELGADVELVVGLPTPDPWSLPFAHQRIFADRLNEYDLFIYSEDDILITRRNVEAFLAVGKVLPEQEIPGFLLYEESADGKINYPQMHAYFHWDPASVRSRGPYTLAFFTNEHTACYVLTQEHLRRAIISGGYLVDPHQGRYDMLCTAATNPYTQCGFKKYVCISHMDAFLVHHLPNKYVGTTFGVDDPELRRQVRALLKIAQNGQHPVSLFETQSKLNAFAYSKDYYEPAQPEVLSAIPEGVRSVLSIGCGWGLTESHLAEKGLHVSAVPLDPVIAGGAEARGVEIINGDLASARQGLTDRKFDCLLLSNVLHLVPNPVEVLSSYTSLLAEGGVAIALTPNMAGPAAWRSLRGDSSAPPRGAYERTGVHWVSRRVLRGWFGSASMKIENIVHLHRKSRTKVRRIASRLLGSWMADGLVVVARKRSDSQAG